MSTLLLSLKWDHHNHGDTATSQSLKLHDVIKDRGARLEDEPETVTEEDQFLVEVAEGDYAGDPASIPWYEGVLAELSEHYPNLVFTFMARDANMKPLWAWYIQDGCRDVVEPEIPAYDPNMDMEPF